MDSLTDLLSKIKIAKRKHKTMLIGIDGVGGAGKTTLSNFLKENLPNLTIVQLDDFYSTKLNRADRTRVLKQVIQPLEKDIQARYQIFDWVADSLTDWFAIEPGGLVVIEGVSALHTDFVESYDFRVWIECFPSVGFKRGVRRDKIRDGVDNTDKWVNIWMPEEKEYIEQQDPKQHADFVLKMNLTPGVNTGC